MVVVSSAVIAAIALSVSAVFLAKFSILTVRHASMLAGLTGVGELAIGFILVSVATSLPELSVAVTSALSNNVSLTIGNVMGANVANVLLIVGLCAFLYPGKVKRSVFGRLSMALFLTALIPLLLFRMADSGSRIGGLILLAAFVGFSFYSLGKPHLLFREGFAVWPNIERLMSTKGNRIAHASLWLAVGVAGVVVSSIFVVNSAVSLAGFLNVAKSVLGATIVSLGTTTPELSVSLAAYRMGKRELALGNNVGSAMVNLTLILGSALSLSAFAVNIGVFSTLLLLAVLASIFLALLIENGRLGRREGAALLVAYGLFLAFTLMAGRIGQA